MFFLLKTYHTSYTVYTRARSPTAFSFSLSLAVCSTGTRRVNSHAIYFENNVTKDRERTRDEQIKLPSGLLIRSKHFIFYFLLLL